ncbi:MAG: patatin-like phospholipase family protein [Gammaproteobacteria bacterium]|nr:patatin-like phospholipase family protein [Gammaproteobacteria bacterium]
MVLRPSGEAVGRARDAAGRKSVSGDIDCVVFSGGGARCFWQAGFWEAVRSSLPQPRAVSAVSGGAAIAAILLSGGWTRFFPRFLELVADNPGNVHFGNLLRSGSVFPHPRISRDSFLHSVSARALQRLRAGPDLRIVISHPPRWLGAWLGALAAAGIDGLEGLLTRRPYTRWVRSLGFETKVVRARECADPEALVRAIFQSSAAPPVFPVTRLGGRPALDGGLVEYVPLSVVSDCRRPLVLLSRYRATLPGSARERYVCPSKPVPVAPWDFASPDRVIATFELGRADGARFVEQVAGGRGSTSGKRRA